MARSQAFVEQRRGLLICHATVSREVGFDAVSVGVGWPSTRVAFIHAGAELHPTVAHAQYAHDEHAPDAKLLPT